MSSKQNKSENLSNTRENELGQQNTSFSRFPQGTNNPATSTASTSKSPDTSRCQLFRKRNKEPFNLDKESELSDSFKNSLNLRDQNSNLLNLRDGNHSSSSSQFSSDLQFGRNYKDQYRFTFSNNKFSTREQNQNINYSVNNSLFQEPNTSQSSHFNSHFPRLAQSPVPFSPHPREFLAPVSLYNKATVNSQNEIPNSYNYSQNPLEREPWLNEYPRTYWYQLVPSPIQRQRPIIGRQLMTMTDNVEVQEPSSMLYPSENEARSVPSTSTTFPNIPPTAKTGRFTTTQHNEISSRRTLTEDKVCTFCRKNGETAAVYSTHYLKKKIGDRKIVTCPILRSLVCTICGASGDEAHTITYCPVLLDRNNGQPLVSTTVILKGTRMQSNGRRRF